MCIATSSSTAHCYFQSLSVLSDNRRAFIKQESVEPRVTRQHMALYVLALKMPLEHAVLSALLELGLCILKTPKIRSDLSTNVAN